MTAAVSRSLWVAQRALLPKRDAYGYCSGEHEDEHSGGVGASLGLDVGAKDQRDDDIDDEQDEDERPPKGSPARGHAKAGQVARDEVEQAGHC